MTSPRSGGGRPAVGRPGVISGATRIAVPPPPAATRRATLALLSAVWPGLGQWRAGRRRAAVTYVVPPVLAILAALAWASLPGRQSLEAVLFQPLIAGSVVVIVIVLGALRLAAMAQAWQLGPRTERTSVSARAAVVAAALLVVLVHGYVARFPLAFLDAQALIFRPDPTTGVATPAPGQTPDPTPAASPFPTGRITILFIGIDLGDLSQPDQGLTDTILLASYDPAINQVDMISLPRDTALFPLYDRPRVLFDQKINALKRVADANPTDFPAGGTATLVREVEYLVGVHIDYYASVEIGGLLQIFEAIGGIDVVNETVIDDPGYEFGYGPGANGAVGFHLEPGPQHLDPLHAMAYLRSRHGTGNSDFQRARRQQQVLLLLREKLHDPQIVLRLPDILPLMAQIVRTDLPADHFDQMMDIANTSDGATVKSVVLGPSKYASLIPPDEIGGQSALRLDLAAVAELSVRLFGDASRYFDPAHPLPSESPEPSP